MITTPRCGMPVREYTTSRPRDFTDPFPVCWRPAGHKSRRHASREYYLRYLARKERARRERRGGVS